MAAGPLDIEIHGEPLTLLPERAAWWPAARTLLISDLHWGKAETMRTAGMPVPRGTVREPLERLTKLAERWPIQRVLVIGDMLHAGTGLTADLVQDVADWRTGFAPAIEVVPGNHDRSIDRVAAAWRLEIRAPEIEEGPFAFVHDPAHATRGCFAWCGHLHPCVNISGAGDKARLPCFFVGENLGVLPAFSTFTGGAGVPRGVPGTLYACAGEGVVEFSCA